LNGECFVIWRGYETARPVSSSFCLTVPLGRISKMGNGYLRRLLVVGATSVMRRAPTIDTRTGTWVRSLLEHKPTRVVTVAIANKTARTAWALLSKGESYKAVPAI
ncbi:IS110 family transposase, partial [Planktomarina temperata]|nr:IS110 family transposase [Planktomarina temperata]